MATMRLAIYIDFLSLPSRRPRCERFRVNVTKTSILGAHQESISIDKGQLTFCLTFLVYPIPVELRREIPLGWRLLALLEWDEIRIRKEINYPFSKVFLFLEKSYRKNRPVFSTLYRIYYGWVLLIASYRDI